MFQSFLMVLVPLKRLEGVASQVVSPLTPSQLARLYEELKMLMVPYFHDDTIPLPSPGPACPAQQVPRRIDSFYVGGALNGMLIGKHLPIPAEKRLEELGEGPAGFRRAEIQRLGSNYLLAPDYSSHGQPIAAELDALIAPDGRWAWLVELNTTEEYDQRYWQLRETAAIDSTAQVAYVDHLRQHPKEIALATTLESFPPCALTVVEVSYATEE